MTTIRLCAEVHVPPPTFLAGLKRMYGGCRPWSLSFFFFFFIHPSLSSLSLNSRRHLPSFLTPDDRLYPDVDLSLIHI